MPPEEPQKLVNRRLAREAQRRDPPAPPASPAHENEDDEDERSVAPTREQIASFTPPRFTPSRNLETFEDLYATFPDIGDGTWRLRVVRLAPKAFGGQQTAGFLGYLDEKITMDDFALRYGGARYDVGVIGPAGRPDDQGVQPPRQLTSIEITVPGPPNLYPSGDDMSLQGPRTGYAMPLQQAEHPNVQTKRMEIEAKERERDRELMLKANTTPEHVVNAIKDQAKETVADIKSMADVTNGLLREQNQGLIAKIVSQDNELRDLRNESVALRAKADSAAREAEVTTEKRMRETHETLIKNLTEAHRKEIDTLKEQHRSALDALKASHDSTMAADRERHRNELTSISTQHNTLINTMTSQHTTAMSQAATQYSTDLARRDADANTARIAAKQQADDRLSDLDKSYQRELSAIRDERNKTVDSIKAQFASTEKISEQGATMRVTLAEKESERLRLLVEKLEKEIEKVRKETTKTPVEYLTEAGTVARDLLGMVRADEIEQPDKEEKFDWKTEAAKAVIGAVGKIPETAQKVAEGLANVRERNAQVHAEARQMAEQQGRGGAPALGGGGGRRGRRGPPPPQPWMDANGIPEPYAGPVVGAEVPFQAPYAPIKREPERPAPTAAPVQQQQTAPTSQPTVPAEGGPQHAQQQEGLVRFIEALELHIRSKVASPRQFAQEFINQVGPEQTAEFIRLNSADNFLAHIENTLPEGQNTPITTRDGRAYVKQVWIEAAKIAAEMLKGGSAQQPEAEG